MYTRGFDIDTAGNAVEQRVKHRLNIKRDTTLFETNQRPAGRKQIYEQPRCTTTTARYLSTADNCGEERIFDYNLLVST